MSQPLSYFDLVVSIVRGRTPIPEFCDYEIDRIELAEKHIELLKKKYEGGSSGSAAIDMAIGMGPGFLSLTWEKMCPSALTMCGDKSLDQLIEALRTISEEKIPGDFIETGVWRGGLPIIMRAFLNSVGDKNRKVWLADSFQGLPKVAQDPDDQAAHLLLEPILHLSASRKQVEKSFDFFGLRDEQVQFLEGWFAETLPNIPASEFSLIRLDGDYYESTRDALTALYPKLAVGGYLIVDDYHLPLGCQRAVDEYRETHGIHEELIAINSQAVYWRRAK